MRAWESEPEVEEPLLDALSPEPPVDPEIEPGYEPDEPQYQPVEPYLDASAIPPFVEDQPAAAGSGAGLGSRAGANAKGFSREKGFFEGRSFRPSKDPGFFSSRFGAIHAKKPEARKVLHNRLIPFFNSGLRFPQIEMEESPKVIYDVLTHSIRGFMDRPARGVGTLIEEREMIGLSVCDVVEMYL